MGQVESPRHVNLATAVMTFVLVVEDEAIISKNIARRLKREGLEVVTAADRASAMKVFLEKNVDFLCLDVELPDGDGLDLLAEFRRTKPDLPAIVITAFTNAAIRNRAAELGVLNYITKPFSLDGLARTIKQILGLTGNQGE